MADADLSGRDASPAYGAPSGKTEPSGNAVTAATVISFAVYLMTFALASERAAVIAFAMTFTVLAVLAPVVARFVLHIQAGRAAARSEIINEAAQAAAERATAMLERAMVEQQTSIARIVAEQTLGQFQRRLGGYPPASVDRPEDWD